jgi:hypothetical protein
MRASILVFAASSFIALAAACGGAQPAQPSTPAATPSAQAAAPASSSVASTTATPPAASSSAPADEPPVPDKWSDDMPGKQKMAFMQARVVPAMMKIFQDAQPQHYADFGCKTCHGPEGKNPHDFLPKLTFKDGHLEQAAAHPELAKFMGEKVTPAMADAMGLPHFDRQTKQGFGCRGCHTVEMP